MQPDDPEGSVPSDETTMTAVLAAFADDGFTANHTVTEEGEVRCGRCRHLTPAGEITLHALRRLEGVSDPDDMAAVMATSCHRCGARGALVVKFGPGASEGEALLLATVEDGRPG